jgi:two-component system nitrogen regulation response regulator GlnG
MSKFLIVDDEPSICWAFSQFLTDEGHTVGVAATAEEGLRLAEADRPDAVVLDVRLPGMDGLTALSAFRARVGPAPIVVITAFGNLDTAVRAVEGGAFDYLIKPFDLDQAAAVLSRAIQARASQPKERKDSKRPSPEPTLIGRSSAMQEVFKQIAVVASTDVPVLITGESGTGKELVALAIHRHSRRRSGPYLPVSMAALSPSLVEREMFGHVRGAFTGADRDQRGLLELADGGTVLLDEVGDVPLPLQVKILRAIEHHEIIPVGEAKSRAVDVRFLAATNRPLNALMASGDFREDLFFRLNVFPIRVPPLRDRLDDVPALVEHFLRQSRVPGADDSPIGKDVLAELMRRPWIGNVRELRNAVEHAAIVARGQPIRREHLPAPSTRANPPNLTADGEIGEQIAAWTEHAMREVVSNDEGSLHDRLLALVESPFLRTVLTSCGDNKAAAAQLIGIHRATLRQKIQKYGIK